MKVVDISKSVGVDISTSVAVNATAQEYLQDIAYNSSTFAYYDKKGNMNPALVDVPVFTPNGTTDKLTFADLTGITIVSKLG